MDYRDSGVDISAGNETVRRIKSLAKATFTAGVLSDIGSFGGLFQLDRERYKEPVLVSSADGVGTKLKVAFMTGRHNTVGADCVVASGHERHFELRADAIGARHQNRLLKLVPIEAKQAAKRADV